MRKRINVALSETIMSQHIWGLKLQVSGFFFSMFLGKIHLGFIWLLYSIRILHFKDFYGEKKKNCTFYFWTVWCCLCLIIMTNVYLSVCVCVFWYRWSVMSCGSVTLVVTSVSGSVVVSVPLVFLLYVSFYSCLSLRVSVQSRVKQTWVKKKKKKKNTNSFLNL